MSRIDELLDQIEALEKELVQELRAIEPKLLYTIRDKKVRFSAEMKRRHKLLVTKWFNYVYDSGFMNRQASSLKPTTSAGMGVES